MDPSITLTLNIGGAVKTIEHGGQLRLISVSGLEASDCVCDMQSYAQLDGGYVSSYRVSPRKIDITFGIYDQITDMGTVETLRRSLISFFDPHKTGLLTVTRTGVTREIDFRINGRVEFKQENIHSKYPQVSVQLICADPYFRDVDAQVIPFREYAPLLSFPYTYALGVGMTSGIATTSDSFTLTNAGDVDAGVVITIDCYGGAVLNPCVTHESGAYVKVLRSCAMGEVITIDTRRGRKGIYVGDDAIFAFDPASGFFSIPVGDSSLTVSADANVGNASISASFCRYYLGV